MFNGPYNSRSYSEVGLSCYSTEITDSEDVMEYEDVMSGKHTKETYSGYSIFDSFGLDIYENKKFNPFESSYFIGVNPKQFTLHFPDSLENPLVLLSSLGVSLKTSFDSVSAYGASRGGYFHVESQLTKKFGFIQLMFNKNVVYKNKSFKKGDIIYFYFLNDMQLKYSFDTVPVATTFMGMQDDKIKNYYVVPAQKVQIYSLICPNLEDSVIKDLKRFKYTNILEVSNYKESPYMNVLFNISRKLNVNRLFNLLWKDKSIPPARFTILKSKDSEHVELESPPSDFYINLNGTSNLMVKSSRYLQNKKSAFYDQTKHIKIRSYKSDASYKNSVNLLFPYVDQLKIYNFYDRCTAEDASI